MMRVTWHPWSVPEAFVCGTMGLLLLVPALRWCSSGVSFSGVGVLKILLAAIGLAFLAAGMATALITRQLTRDTNGVYTFKRTCGVTTSSITWSQDVLDKLIVSESYDPMPFGGKSLTIGLEVQFLDSTPPLHINLPDRPTLQSFVSLFPEK